MAAAPQTFQCIVIEKKGGEQAGGRDSVPLWHCSHDGKALTGTAGSSSVCHCHADLFLLSLLHASFSSVPPSFSRCRSRSALLRCQARSLLRRGPSPPSPRDKCSSKCSHAVSRGTTLKQRSTARELEERAGMECTTHDESSCSRFSLPHSFSLPSQACAAVITASRTVSSPPLPTLASPVTR